MPSASVSIASAPSMIGSCRPGSQIQIVRPIAVSSEPAASAGTQRSGRSGRGTGPTISTTIEPPIVANSGDSAW